MNAHSIDLQAIPLRHWGVIRASGADAASFLHGQLTQDVVHLDPAQARLAGYCSAKGRLLASFVVWRSGDDVLLACHASLLAATLKRLSMFVLRAKCRLSDATAEFALLGHAGAAVPADVAALPAWAVLNDAHGTWLRLTNAAGVPRAWRIDRADAGAPDNRSSDPALLADWQWLEVESGIVTIEQATADQFVPQMLNFELIGAVNFQKGCYPGQEIVARSQYRGTTKRRTFLFECDAPAAPGLEVFHSSDPGQPAGMVASSARAPATAGAAHAHRALVEIKLAALESGEVRLGDANGPLLTLMASPYPIPLADEGTRSAG